MKTIKEIIAEMDPAIVAGLREHSRLQAQWAEEEAQEQRIHAAHEDLLNIAKLAANGTYINPNWAREILEKHGLSK